MRLSSVVRNSTTDGPGNRLTLHVQGSSSSEVESDTVVSQLVDDLHLTSDLDGITFSGGEPFDQALECAKLAIEVKHRFPNFSVWTFTGYTYEEILNANNYVWNLLLDVSDVLVDGPFLPSQEISDLPYRRSSNQRLISVKISRESGHVVEYELNKV